MADNHPEFRRIEVDHTFSDITIRDESDHPAGPLQLFCLIDRTTRQMIRCWLEPVAAPPVEEPPLLP